MKKTNLLAILALAATPAFLHAQTTSYSDVVGYMKSSFPAGTSGHSASFVKPDLYTGSATKSGASTFAVSGLSLANNSLAPAGGLPTHYVEITSGSLEGYSVDVVSNSGTTVVVSGSLPVISGTVSISIRPHVKVSDIFKGNTSLADYTDTILVYNSDGSTVSLLRDSSAATGWVDPNTFAAADLVIYPGQAFLLNASGGGDFTFSGNVKKTATLVPLYATSVNYVSAANPSSNPSLQNSNLGTNLADYVDTVGTFSTDGNFTQTATYLWAGSADKFIDPNTFSSVSNGVTLPGAQAVLVGVSSDTTWKLAPPYTP